MLASQQHIGLGLVQRVRRGLEKHKRSYVSFYEFVQKMWDVIIPEDPTWNWHIKVICDEMQAVAERVFKGEPKEYDLVINVPPGSTKALAVDTPVMTTWGWKKHGDLRPGDYVFGPEGKPRRVIAVTPHEYRESSRVMFTKMGEPIVAANTHLWQTDKNGVRRTDQLKTGERPDSIIANDPIEFPPIDLLVDPYLLGAWLGDGCSSTGWIGLAKEDAHILDRYESKSYDFHRNFTRRTISGLSTKLRVSGLLGNKHIPQNYLRASIEQRMELLRGLMDTDGTCDEKGACSFTNKNKALIDGMRELLSSLGMPHSTKKFYVTSGFNGKRHGPYYMVSFRPPAGRSDIFTLKRKQQRVLPVSLRGRRRYLKSVEPCGKVLVNCITVEGELYLAGRDMVTTHNSTICSIMFPAWFWTRMPTGRVICGSYAKQLALELSRKTRDIVMSPQYQEMVGGMSLKQDQNTKGHFVNDKKGGRLATSTGGAVTGFHGHVIVVDDPLNPQEAASESDNRTAHSWIGQTLSTRKVDKSVTPTILIMQRLHEDDPAGRMIAEMLAGTRGIKHINLPAEIDDRNRKDVRPRWLRRMYTPDPDRPGSKLLDPVRIPRAVLEEFKSENLLGEYGYAGQMLQRPVPFGGGLFKIERIEVHQIAPAEARFTQKIRFWDKAGTAGGGAYSVGVEMGEDVDGGYWILDVVRKQMDTGERTQRIRQTAELDGPDIYVGVEQEPGSGGKESAENTVKDLAGFSVIVVRPSGDKTVRAIPFSAQVNIGNVYMVVGEWNKVYLKELELFPVSKYKDQVDASSGAFTALTQGPTIGVIK